MSLAIASSLPLPTMPAPASPARQTGGEEPDGATAADANTPTSTGAASGSDAAQDDERRELQELEARDREVRAHEAAHLAAAGGLAMGGANFSLQRGPDGRMYAVGGEVSIDVSEGRTPEATIARAERIRAAALAPAEPSAKDMQVAARATRMAAEARAELATAVRESYGERPAATPGAHVDEHA